MDDEKNTTLTVKPSTKHALHAWKHQRQLRTADEALNTLLQEVQHG